MLRLCRLIWYQGFGEYVLQKISSLDSCVIIGLACQWHLTKVDKLTLKVVKFQSYLNYPKLVRSYSKTSSDNSIIRRRLRSWVGIGIKKVLRLDWFTLNQSHHRTFTTAARYCFWPRNIYSKSLQKRFKICVSYKIPCLFLCLSKRNNLANLILSKIQYSFLQFRIKYLLRTIDLINTSSSVN